MYLSVHHPMPSRSKCETAHCIIYSSSIYVFECTTITLAMALAGWSWLSSTLASALQIPEIEPAEAAAWKAGLQLNQLEQHYIALYNGFTVGVINIRGSPSWTRDMRMAKWMADTPAVAD